MSQFTKFLAGSIVMLGMGFAGLSSAQAGGYGYGYDYAPQCHYEWVTTWHFKTVQDVVYVTLYDHCGHPYQAEKIVFRTIKVPVRNYVKVCH